MELSPELWREVLDAAGANERFSGTFSHQQLLQSLLSSAPDERLLDALEVIFELGTDEGREFLLSAADDQQVSLGSFDHLPARELAARLWIRSQSESALRKVLLRARVYVLGAVPTRTRREFVGKSARPASSLERDRLRAAIAQKCTELGQSEALDIDSYLSEGEWRCDVLRGEAAKRVIEIRSGQAGVLNYQPASSDHLRYDPETGRLGISTRSPRRLRLYREVMGLLLAEDAEFFAGENICSLKPLLERGSKLFDDHPLVGVRHVDVTELRWRRGDRDKITVSGRDCFRVLEDVGARFHEGELIEAKLAIDFAGQARRGSVLIKVPNRIEIKAGGRESLVEQLLDRVGIRGTFEDGERKDFWSLYPWRLDATSWRQHVGADFDRLVRAHVLRRTELDAVTHPNHPEARGALAVEVLDAATIIGVSDDPAIGLRTLTPSDIEAYEPDCNRLASEIARALELTGPITELMSGLWALGQRELSPSHTLALFVATRRPSDSAAPCIREKSKGALAVLVAPRGCACELQFPQVDCDVLRGPYNDLLARSIEVLELQEHVPPVLWARGDLIIDEGRGKAWYRGVELTQLRVGTHPWNFALAVARANGAVVSKEELQSRLSPNSRDDGVAKKAKRDFVDVVKKSFREQGQACSDINIFDPAGSGGYRLSATACVL